MGKSWGIVFRITIEFQMNSGSPLSTGLLMLFSIVVLMQNQV